MPTIEVDWDTETDDGDQTDLPPTSVNVPQDIYDWGFIDPDDPVSDWLSDQYGYLVKGWQLKGCNYR